MNLRILLVALALGLIGCAPSTGMTARATALNGMYQPAPVYAYQPQPWPVAYDQWHSQYMVPRVSCVAQGATTVCHPI